MALRVPGVSDQPSKWSATDPWTEITYAPGAFPSSPQLEDNVEFAGQQTLASALKERRRDYIRKKEITVKVGTWNVASISSTYRDLAAWFVKGLGVKGLHQDLSGISNPEDSDYSSEDGIESVEAQESRAGRKSSTVPVGEVAAIPSDGEVGLYILGLQEVIDISSFTETMRPYYDPNPAKKWKRAMKRGLPPGYVKIAEQQLLGLLILIYAAPQIAPQISSVDCTSVGTGALGYMGNKGAVSVRFVLGGTTRLLFVNCHLAAGADQAALARRIWDTNQILSRTKFGAALLEGDVNSTGSESIGDEDLAFWFGDLNYRLDDIPGEDVRRLLLLHTRNEYDSLNKSKMRIDSELGYIDAPADNVSTSADSAEQDETGGVPAKESSADPPLDPKNDPASLITTLTSLLKHDQLQAQQRLRKAFHEGWREGEINFLPTYKYDVGSVGMFDSGEKKRSPSWCDRILYRTKKDRLEYEERVKQEAESRKRDEQMKAQGLDKASAEQEILFDYDPENDGADEYDEYDEAEENIGSQPGVTEPVAEDSITLEEYISHQRVLSSDHKPLSAVFHLIYDAVIPELKAQVQQEVARMLDKTENETRPNVTLVVDNPSENSANADGPTGSSELNSVEFDEVRYHVPKTRTLTIANTGAIPATFAFIDRPTGDNMEKGPFPSWMYVEVHYESQPTPKTADDLGLSTRFELSPGDVATVDITIDIVQPEFVYALNEGTAHVDDILVLRIQNGRDHFISIKGTWVPTSFYRYLDELVRLPYGIRSKPSISGDEHGKPRKDSAANYHSAPKELFELTEILPGMVERATADWTMTHQNIIPPWEKNHLWPFQGHAWKPESEILSSQIANLREALDTLSPLTEQFDGNVPPLGRAELLAETLVGFLQSLQDGIVPAIAWQVIEEKLIVIEKSKGRGDPVSMQDIVMEALSPIPVHSVSLTFVTFMLARIVTEISSSASEAEQFPVTPTSRHARSSTESSQTPSEFSVASTDSASTISSLLPSLTRRKTGSQQPATPPTTLKSPADRKARAIDAYSDFLSGIIFRSERDAQAKAKDKKVLDGRKKKVLAALLDSPSM